IGAFPRITITSWHNNGATIVNGIATPPAFNPDGLADRNGNLTNEFGSFFFVPPWTRDAKWGKFFVAVDTDGDCQFFDNITQSVLNGTVDRAPTSISMSFSGGLRFNLPSTWKVAFNHAAIRRALGQ